VRRWFEGGLGDGICIGRSLGGNLDGWDRF
jgi:hypothetical protein